MIFSIDLHSTKRNNFILKRFIPFTGTNLDEPERGGNFFNWGTQKGGGFPKERVPTLEETMGVPQVSFLRPLLFKGCVRYIYASLFFMSKREHL